MSEQYDEQPVDQAGADQPAEQPEGVTEEVLTDPETGETVAIPAGRGVRGALGGHRRRRRPRRRAPKTAAPTRAASESSEAAEVTAETAQEPAAEAADEADEEPAAEVPR